MELGLPIVSQILSNINPYQYSQTCLCNPSVTPLKPIHHKQMASFKI
jgi:hypothetical protein